MQKKLFFNLVFLIVGTFILAGTFVIVAVNFVRDSRIFAKPAQVSLEETTKTVFPGTGKRPAASTGQVSTHVAESTKPQTFTYRRTVDPPLPQPAQNSAPRQESNTAATTTAPPSKTAEDGSVVPEKPRVEVLNYSGIKNLAEELRALLEANGFEVSAGNGTSNKPVKTEIIERNDKNVGQAVKNIIKVGSITKSPDPDSRFDATIIIGDDYMVP